MDCCADGVSSLAIREAAKTAERHCPAIVGVEVWVGDRIVHDNEHGQGGTKVVNVSLTKGCNIREIDGGLYAPIFLYHTLWWWSSMTPIYLFLWLPTTGDYQN